MIIEHQSTKTNIELDLFSTSIVGEQIFDKKPECLKLVMVME